MPYKLKLTANNRERDQRQRTSKPGEVIKSVSMAAQISVDVLVTKELLGIFGLA